MLLTYSPSRCDPALLRRLTVGESRTRAVATLVDAVRAELGNEVHQHQLLVGPRGSGKTHVLTLVADRLESDPELAERVLPVSLAEEEVTRHPADLVIKILERLENRLTGPSPMEGRSQALAVCRDVLDRLRSESDDDQALILAAGTLEEIAERLGRLLVPMVENLDSVFYTGYSRDKTDRAQWALRKILMESKGMMLLASAPSLFGDVADEGAPFYDSFRTLSLGELPREEILDLIRRRIEVELGSGGLDNATERRLRTLLSDFDRRRARLWGFLVITGGLPRFAHLLFDLLAETDVTSVVGLLNRFLDTQTPYFQSRLDPRIVPKAELEILETLATADGPLLVGEITSRVRGAVRGNVSNYLKRLRRRGLVRQRGRRQEVRYDLSEPLFRVWRRFRIGRGEREQIETLAELVAAAFTPVELQKECRDLADLPKEDLRRQAVDYALDVSVPPTEIAEPRVAYGIGDSEQTSEEIRQREAENRRLRKELDELWDAQALVSVVGVFSSVSDNIFRRSVELSRHAEQEGIRIGIVRFCVAALVDPTKLLEWLPLFESEFPVSRRELLRPIRLAVEILTERKDRELPMEPEEMRRAVTELLEKVQTESPAEVGPSDLVNQFLQALKERPTAVALDTLWALRVEIEQQESSDPGAIHEVDKVLAACCRRAGDWVRRAVRQADATTEPVHGLAYLLLKVEDGRQLWLDLKETFFAKISEEKERSIAYCLEFFHDDAHIEWLESRVHREDDLVGAAARRALFVLCPGRPPDPVGDEEWGFSLAPNWWLQPHLNAGSVEAVNLIAEKLANSDDPWGTAFLLGGLFENRIAPEVLERLLDVTKSRLVDELAEPGKGSGNSLWGPFSSLARIHAPPLVKCFESRCGTEFEELLTRWLCKQGPNNTDMKRHWEADAIRVLEMVGGDGLSRVSHCYLRDGRTFWALLEAIELAVMRPDEQTAELLFEVAMRDDVEHSPHNISQVTAVGALATIGRLDLALRGVMKWGIKIQIKTTSLFSEHHPTAEDMRPILEALEAPEGPNPNAVLAIGLARREEEIPRLHSILKSSPKESELYRSCLFALWLIGDSSPATIQTFVDNLDIPENEYPSWSALWQIHTPEALNALKNRLSGVKKERNSSSDAVVRIASHLLTVEDTRRDIAEYLWTEVNHRLIPFIAGDDLKGFAELDREDVRQWLHDLAEKGDSFHHGAQLGAIRALAKRETDYAFEAARRLTVPDAPNREDVPALLLEIDSDRALPILREWVETEASVLVLAMIGEAVFVAGRLQEVIGWLQDPSPRLREGACIAAEILPWTDELARVLRERLYDEDWDVRTAANRTLDRIWHAREIDRLVDEIVAEADTTRRWCLLSVALDGGLPGLTGPYRQQPWAARLFDNLPLAMRQRVFDRLEKRRKELRGKMKKRDRQA